MATTYELLHELIERYADHVPTRLVRAHITIALTDRFRVDMSPESAMDGPRIIFRLLERGWSRRTLYQVRRSKVDTLIPSIIEKDGDLLQIRLFSQLCFTLVLKASTVSSLRTRVPPILDEILECAHECHAPPIAAKLEERVV